MESNVVIKIIDTANGLDFEIPISSGKNTPLSISKKISDLTNITKRSGVQSRSFKIPISKDIATSFGFFNESSHHNYKDVDGDKDASILIDGNEFERGKVRVVNYINDDRETEVELIFIGNNFAWTELLKNKTLSDLTWINKTIIYKPEVVKASWTNTVAAGDEWVFPLENRGGRKLGGMVHTEDFRPAVFLYKLFERAFISVGYTFKSTFFETSLFKTLILTFFGKRFLISEEDVINNFVRAGHIGNISSVGTSSDFINIITLIIPTINFDVATAPNIDLSGAYNSGTNTFTVQETGYYDFSLAVKGTTDQFFVPKYTITLRDVNTIMFQQDFIGTVQNAVLGSGAPFSREGLLSNVFMKAGWTITIQDFLTLSNNAFPPLSWNIQYTFFRLEFKMRNIIAEKSTFNLADVLDDKVKVLDIINDVSRMFNLMLDTDPVLKKVTIEPRDDFYRDIVNAKDFTSRIDVSKKIQTNYNSSSHKKEMVFSYANDDKDVFVQERNKELGTTLAEYSHDLPSKFRLGITPINTSVIAATDIIKDYDSVGLTEGLEAPYTSRYWNEYALEAPPIMLQDHAPRILSYSYAVQEHGSPTISNSFRFYDESSNRTVIPFCLPHGNFEASIPVNLYWHSTDGLSEEGLFATYWSKTVTEIINGVNASVFMIFNNKTWKDFNFRDVIYIDQPVDIKGYWLVEAIDNFQPENSSIVKVNLLQRIEYDKQVEAPPLLDFPIIPGVPFDSLSPATDPSGSEPMLFEFLNEDEDILTVPMLIENEFGQLSNMIFIL